MYKSFITLETKVYTFLLLLKVLQFPVGLKVLQKI